MRKITMLNRISLDGFFAGPNGEIDWFIHDSEVDKAAHGMGKTENRKADTILFGRITYQMFENYWPNIVIDPNAPRETLATANELNEMTKIVFSKTLKEVNWENSKLVKGNLIEEVRKLKQGKGNDMIIFGSGTIVNALAGKDLIDEYLFVVTPVILGAGKPLFREVKRNTIKLLEAMDFQSGNVLLRYSR